MGADFDAGVTADAPGGVPADGPRFIPSQGAHRAVRHAGPAVLAEVDGLRVVAVVTAEIAPLKEDGRPVAGAVHAAQMCIRDSQICVECGLCNQVCPFGQHKDNKEKIPLGVYGFKHKSNEVRILSSSGGAFTAIANMVLEKKGVVYGCAFNDKYEAVHIRITTCQALERIRKSKYVQSRLDDIFLQVQADLEEEKYVLFTGTACQVAGLSKYIEQDVYKRQAQMMLQNKCLTLRLLIVKLTI